ncbi:M23 family metallopeptidase [Stigmatella sp. ncwal1]|uniref:M23 family metallopeptidase n=1 Tax=Stigmatella ashevillensis TaxID=2995309 RepID=A0ABT5DK56_9BACT|nr:M23 family metallopeptidase [Stigmatella ashevillena]MDC0714008.1 M23 family metallopeptidase [Stigmatella ashevillena]
MSRLAAIALVALSACATPRADKVSFEEAFGSPSASPPAEEALPAPVRRPKRVLAAPGVELPSARKSLELEAALAFFVDQARAYRRVVERGSPMTSSQVQNWEQINGALDAFLERPAAKTSSLDVVRARVTLESELEEDARTYGDIPPELAEAVMSRVSLLAVRMTEVRGLVVKSSRQAPRLSWPLEPVSVTSHFGERVHPIKGEVRDHLGVDLAARRGQAIAAAAPGVVLRAGWNGAHGYSVEVQHAERVLTRYSHLSRVLVETGEILERGDVLGLAGDTGLATGVHLHFELWEDGQPIDPLDGMGSPQEAVAGGASLSQR